MTQPVRFAVALTLALTCAAPMVAQTPKYHVTVTTDDKADFAKFKTYTWENGWQAYDKTVHANIRASIDRRRIRQPDQMVPVKEATRISSAHIR